MKDEGAFESSVNSEYSKTWNVNETNKKQFESSVNSEYSKTKNDNYNPEKRLRVV